jgi:hypothetical protein
MTRTYRSNALIVVCVTAFALTLAQARDVPSQDGKPGPLDGAWKLIEAKNGGAQEYQKLPEGTQEIKYVTGGRFIWIVFREGQITAAAGGKYTVEKDKYTEVIEYFVGDGQQSLVGKTFDFTWKLDGGTWLHVGVIKVNDQDLKIDEKWERCK